MKKGLCIAGFLVLAAQPSLWGHMTHPSTVQIIPEVIWAAATGGGTWVTEVQITNFSSEPIDIDVEFRYGGGAVGVALYSGLGPYHSLRYSNILAELQTINPAFTFYGRIGALRISGGLIHTQAKTVNGNYGKTFPGLNIHQGNTAAVGRWMMIQDLVRSSAYRTSVGFINWNTIGEAYIVEFRIVDADNNTVGTPFTKTITAAEFISFNPFAQAGITSGTYENCWLRVEVTTGTSATDGLIGFGSIANNFSNDTYALIAKIFYN